MLRSTVAAAATVTAFALLLTPALAGDDLAAKIRALAGSQGVVYVAGEDGKALVDLNGSKDFIPASTLKVFTCLVAAEHLGMESRFETRFFLDGDMLVVRGGGDPFLVSEELDRAAIELKQRLGDQVLAGVAIDDSFFEEGIKVPGVSGSDEPYDALNSATAVNFNTINVVVDGGSVRSAEAQTPLTPLARTVARRRGVQGKLRINLSSSAEEVRRYAGELIAAKLRAAGLQVGEAVTERKSQNTTPLYVHRSDKTVRDVCSALLYYSNNYMANQVFLAVGAKVYGEPASLQKSSRVFAEFIAAHPELEGVVVTEGSGISYENRATGRALAAILTLFEPYKTLLRRKGGTHNKTGTLKVTRSVIGYADTRQHGTVRYVISLDAAGSARRWKIVDLLREHL